ncbi:MAG: uroporphyrinogen-III synthase [Sphingobacteriales bacterium]|nr:uroporphyrinogen-III synthase [Sphingobacteriales bacterium]
MQAAKYSILSTRPLQEAAIAEAASAGIRVDAYSFIETKSASDMETIQKIKQAYRQSATVVFTSMNAVEAVAAQQEGRQPGWHIYCTNHATRQLVEKYFGKDAVAGTAGSAAELAEIILADAGLTHVLFFCGDQRRDELPFMLRKNHIEVEEIQVYQTIPVPHLVREHYDGILFFSPSAVAAFFSNNRLPGQTTLFAIGPTTAEAIRKYSRNKTVISDQPGKEYLLQAATRYFHHQ